MNLLTAIGNVIIAKKGETPTVMVTVMLFEDGTLTSLVGSSEGRDSLAERMQRDALMACAGQDYVKREGAI